VTQPHGARWFVRGDVDGFFGLALDNLIQLLVIGALTTGVLGFPAELVYGRVLPGAAVSVLLGNVFYAWQAKRLAARTGSSEVAALPYGINTVSLFAFIFLVMLPAKLAATAAGADPVEAAYMAWRAGLVACLGSALIEIAGALVAEWIRRATPRAALLSALAGVAASFIALGFLLRTFASPLVGMTTLAVILVCYFGRVQFAGGLPGGLVAVLLGTGIAWATGVVTASSAAWGSACDAIGWYPPVLVLSDLGQALSSTQAFAYLSVIVPMGVINVVGSLQNIESAEAAGDAYDTRSSLLANGIGTLAAAVFGSCFPTTIYIGHPGWKALGARVGYSILNGVFVTWLCLTGSVALVTLLVPIEAGMAIVVWIGIIIVAQAFSATPDRHAPAVAVGILPGIAAWGVFMLKQGLRAAGTGSPAGPPFGPAVEDALALLDVSARGAFALEQGALVTAMILSAVTVEIIERRFRTAAVWCAVAAALSWVGMLHAYGWTQGDTVVDLRWGAGAPWTAGYLGAAAFLVVVPWVTRSRD
jgi:AGZA family xanthine/uracil permease-like MFS transporter